MAQSLATAIDQLLSSYNELNTTRIDELLSEPTPLEFMRYVASNRPFIVRNAVRSWQAYQKWNIEYLLSTVGSSVVNVATTPDGLADSVLTTNGGEVFVEPLTQNELFSDALQYILSHESDAMERPVKYCQTQNDNLRSEYKALFEDVPNTVTFAEQALGNEPDAINFWLGSQSSITSLHKDNYENIYAQIRGTKRFLLIPPIMAPAMEERLLPLARWQKAEEGDVSAKCGMTAVPADSEQRIPVPTWDPLKHERPSNEFGKHVQPIQIELHEGDMMYLPAMWYHHVRQTDGEEGFNCSVNYWYDMDFSGQFWSTNSFLRDLSLMSDTKEA